MSGEESGRRLRRAGWTGLFGLSGVTGFGLGAKLVVATAVVAVGASAVVGSAPAPGEDTWSGDIALPELQVEKSVAGAVVPVAKAVGVDHAVANALVEPPVPEWPEPGTAVVDLAAEKAQAPELPVRIRGGGDAPARVRVEVLDRETARGLGVDGVVLTLDDPDGTKGGSVGVELDYSAFAHAYGGNWGSRLFLVQLPECALTTPELPQCRTAQPVPGSNHSADQVLSGRVGLAADEPSPTPAPEPSSPTSAPAPTTGTPTSSASPTPRSTAASTTPALPDDLGQTAPQGYAQSDSSPTVLAAVAGAKGPEGDFTASDLAPSGSWSAGTSSGDFAFSYPMPVPPVPGGLAPTLNLGYNSGSVDGRTAETNNQTSWVGDGWSFAPGGFIERTYKSCAEDEGGNQGSDDRADLCWAGEHVTISVGGVNGELLKDAASGAWVARSDSGARIELKTGATNGDDNGEHWKVTATDGTQYFLGLNRLPGWASGKPVTNSVFTAPVFGNHANEPCHATAFADSWCQQAYRWNLDLVIDRHGNAMVFKYAQEKNRYTRAGIDGAATEYVRGGHLTAIEYGLRDDALFAAPPAKVDFEVAERCLPSGAITCAPEQRTEANAGHWPDVPIDLICPPADDCKAVFENFEWNPGVHSPAFFTTKRLTKVTTKADVGGLQAVDSWALTHLYPLPGDGSDPSLWLSSVQRTGHVGGTASTPKTTFEGTPKDNRVDGTDEIRPLPRYRLTGVDNGYGGYTGVRYHDPECLPGQTMPAPQDNTLRCYPIYWTPYAGYDEPILDWFHKHVVAEVVEQDRTGGNPAVRTNYEYLGGGAWAWDDNELAKAEERTWSQWRGFATVRTIVGDEGSARIVTEQQFLRGMHHDRLPNNGKRSVSVQGTDDAVVDHEAAQGFLREERRYLAGELIALTINDPWVHGPTATEGEKKAFKIGTETVRARAVKADGTWHRTQVNTEFDTGGFPTEIENMGSVSAWDERTASGDEKCSRTTYSANTTAHLLGLASSTTSHAGTCDTQAAANTVLSAARMSYDGQAHGVAPTKGLLTRAQKLVSWEGDDQVWSETSAEHDAYGRMVSAVDVLGGEKTTAYQPATGLVTSVTVTDALGYTAVTELDPRRGIAISVTDAAGVKTQGEFDPLGRTLRAWAPGQGKERDPIARFAYVHSASGPSYIKTEALQDSGAYRTSYTLLDGLLRARQVQAPGATGGRVVTDTLHDSRGLVVKTNNGYYNQDAPAAALLGVTDNAVPNQTVNEYDTLGRPTAGVFRRYAEEQWRSTTKYHGTDRVSTIPPTGGTAVTVITDAFGRKIEKRDYEIPAEAGSDTAAFQATQYTYTRKDLLATVVDPSGAKWTFTYDLAGNRVGTSDPDSGVSNAVFNEANQVVRSTDARGATLAYAYDAVGRMTAVHDGSLTGPKLTEFTYDTLGDGRPVGSVRYVGKAAYRSEITGYDASGRPTGSKITIPAEEGQLAGEYVYATTYTNTGKVDTETVPAAGGLDREIIHHTYDGAGLPKSSWAFNTANGNRATYVSDTVYTVYGEVLQTIRGAATSTRNVVTTSTYEDGTRRLLRHTVDRETSTQSQVSDRRYSYDPAGHITRISDVPAGSAHDTQCFDHDWLGRLSTAWTPANGDCSTAPSAGALGGAAPYWLEWQFDEAGNRTTETARTSSSTTIRTYDYPDVNADGLGKPHALSSVSEATAGGAPTVTAEFGYDASGNTITRNVGARDQVLEWNSEGRVSKVTEGNQVSSYVYDAAGVRLIARDPSGTTLYLPGQELKLATGLSTVSCIRYYSHGGGVALQRSSSQGLSYLVGDHQGTGVLALKTSDLSVSRRYQLPYGGARGAVPAWPNLKGFVGGDIDPTGLVHVGAREYDPSIGRFLSLDPIIAFSDTRQMHGYVYSNHNPITFSDPTGLFCDSCPYDEERGWTGIVCPKSPDGRCRTGTDGTGGYVPGQQGNGGGGGSWGGNGADPNADPMDQPSIAGFRVPTLKELNALRLMHHGYQEDEYDHAIRDWAYKTCMRPGDFNAEFCAIATDNGWLEPANPGLHDFLFSMLPVADLADCVGGSIEGCGWLLANAIPGAKALKVLDKVKPCSSFVPGTEVLMADGTTKPIEEVEVGDVVLAADPETGESGPRPVTATITSAGRKQLVEVTVSAAEEPLVATTEHPFWVIDRAEWTGARWLVVGDDLSSSTGTSHEVQALRVWSQDARVHNLTVADLHTYYVLAGATPVLVHNAGGPCKEVVLNSFGSFEQARNKALDLLGDIDPATRQPYVGRLESSPTTYGKVVGFTTRVNGEFKRFRMDFDPVKGPHINVEVGKGDSARKWAVPWNGTEDDFARMLGGNS